MKHSISIILQFIAVAVMLNAFRLEYQWKGAKAAGWLWMATIILLNLVILLKLG